MNIDQIFLNAVIGSLRATHDSFSITTTTENPIVGSMHRLVEMQTRFMAGQMADAFEAGQQATAPDGSLTAEVHGQYQEGAE